MKPAMCLDYRGAFTSLRGILTVVCRPCMQSMRSDMHTMHLRVDELKRLAPTTTNTVRRACGVMECRRRSRPWPVRRASSLQHLEFEAPELDCSLRWQQEQDHDVKFSVGRLGRAPFLTSCARCPVADIVDCAEAADASRRMRGRRRRLETTMMPCSPFQGARSSLTGDCLICASCMSSWRIEHFRARAYSATLSAGRGDGGWRRSACGRLRIAGRDRLKFLHGQSTAGIESLTAGQGCDTCFITAQVPDGSHLCML